MSVDLTGVRAAARESGIPRGTLIYRLRCGKSLREAVAMGLRTQEEAHPRSAARVAIEAAGVARTTARRRAAQGLPPEVVLDPKPLGRSAAIAGAADRAAFLAEAIERGIPVALASAMPSAAGEVLPRWSTLPLSTRVLWVLRGGPQRASDLVWLLGESHRRMQNVLSGLRTRRLVEEIGKVRKAPGYGPALVPLWRVTKKDKT